MGHLGAGAPSSLPCAGSAPVTCRLEAWLPLRKSPCSPHRLISSPAYDDSPAHRGHSTGGCVGLGVPRASATLGRTLALQCNLALTGNTAPTLLPGA
jgi:hypothetical protein